MVAAVGPGHPGVRFLASAPLGSGGWSGLPAGLLTVGGGTVMGSSQAAAVRPAYSSPIVQSSWAGSIPGAGPMFRPSHGSAGGLPAAIYTSVGRGTSAHAGVGSALGPQVYAMSPPPCVPTPWVVQTSWSSGVPAAQVGHSGPPRGIFVGPRFPSPPAPSPSFAPLPANPSRSVPAPFSFPPSLPPFRIFLHLPPPPYGLGTGARCCVSPCLLIQGSRAHYRLFRLASCSYPCLCRRVSEVRTWQ